MLLLQEFGLEIQGKNGIEKQVVIYLTRLDEGDGVDDKDLPIYDYFLHEYLGMITKMKIYRMKMFLTI